jgi:hypothetical protein
MADVIYDRLSGIPPEQGLLTKQMPDGSFAPVNMGIAGLTPVLSLSAQSAVSTAGVMLDNVGVRNNHSIVVITAGTVSGGTVQLQGSQDNVNWSNLLATALAPLSTAGQLGGQLGVWLATANLTPFRFLRAFIATAITGGGTISAYVASAG